MENRFSIHTSNILFPLIAVVLFAVIGTLLLLNSNAGPQDPNDPNYPLADTNGDLTVDIFDLSYLLGQWSTSDPTADFTGDGAVNVIDLSYLLAQWGRVDTPSGGNPNALYVATTGSDGNDGRSSSSPKQTIQAALDIAVAGDTVYVKAGTYSNQAVAFPRDGSAGNPITIEGYKNTPGDRPTLPNFGDGSPLQPNELPVLDGNNRGGGIAINTASRDYVTARNVMITEYGFGVSLADSAYATVDSVYVKHTGTNDHLVYHGVGIKVV